MNSIGARPEALEDTIAALDIDVDGRIGSPAPVIPNKFLGGGPEVVGCDEGNAVEAAATAAAADA